MADIFSNIGTGITGAGTAGAQSKPGMGERFLMGFSQSARKQEQEIKMMELQQQLQILQTLPEGSNQRPRMAKYIMKKYRPEIAAMAQQGDYQAQQPDWGAMGGGRGGFKPTVRTGPGGGLEGISWAERPEQAGTFQEIEDPNQPGQNINALIDPKTGNIIKSFGQVTGDDELDKATVLRKEFDASKAYKDFQTIQRSEKGLKAAYKISAAKDTKSRIASDQALGVLFQKMLDPDSVVRESEYARTPEGASFVNRLKSYIPKLMKGGLAISDEDRKAIVEIASKLLTESKRTLNTHIDRYTGIAKDYGVNPRLILGNIKRFEISGESGAPQPPQPPLPPRQGANGVKALFKQYGETYETLSSAQKVAINRAWDAAVKDNVSGREFVNQWRSLYGGKK